LTTPERIAEALLPPVLSAPQKGRRRLVAIAGPPASGKSTISAILADRLIEQGSLSIAVPMDGFHLDNAILETRDLLARKGAPETFDVGGLTRLVQALAQDETVYFPVFDRARDIAIAAAGIVEPTCRTVIIEGNYLLFDAPVWRDLASCWDFSVWLDVPREELSRRLVARWLHHGLSAQRAEARASRNDLPNADLVSRARLPADRVIDM